MAAQIKVIHDQTVVALKLKIATIQQLLTPPDDGQIDSKKVDRKLAGMEKDFLKFKVQNANYTAVTGLVFDKDNEDEVFKDCYNAREDIIDLYNDVFSEDAPAVGPMTNAQYNWIWIKVQALQEEIDERIQAVQTGIDNDGLKTAAQLAMYADELERAQAEAKSDLNAKYQKLYKLKPTKAETTLQTKKTWAVAMRVDLFAAKTDLAAAKDTMLSQRGAAAINQATGENLAPAVNKSGGIGALAFKKRLSCFYW